MIDYKHMANRMRAVLNVIKLNEYTVAEAIRKAIDARLNDWDEAHAEPEYPLPDWAERYNNNHELIEGTQLCTKDGRQRGNARIISIDYNNPVFPTGSVLYKVRTDIGTDMNLLADEINSMFFIGRYILKPGQ